MLRRTRNRLAGMLCLALTSLALPALPATAAASDPASYVNPFVGTQDGGPDFGTAAAPGWTSPARWCPSA